MFQIPNGLDPPSEFHVAMVQLIHFQAFNTIYNITDANNTLELFVQKYNSSATALDATNQSVLITIPNGSYDVPTLVNSLNSSILSKCPAVLRGTNSRSPTYYYYSGFGYSQSFQGSGSMLNPVNFDYSTGLLWFQIPTLSVISDSTNIGTYSASGITGNTSFASNIYSGFYIITDKYTGLLKTLGFSLNDDVALPTAIPRNGFGVQLLPTITSSAGIISVQYSVNKFLASNLNRNNTSGNFAATNLLNLSYPRSLNITSTGIATNNRSVTPNLSYGNLLINIPVDCSFGEVISYTPSFYYPLKISGFQLNNFMITILDEDGIPVNFNNTTWKIVLGISWALDVGASGDESVYQGRNLLPPDFSSGYDRLEKKRRV
jgi:hypothetical protein